MNHKRANRPPSNLLQTFDSADRVEQVVDSFSELVFRSPAIKETFGNRTLVILVIAFGFLVVLIGVVSILTGYESTAVGLPVLLTVAFVGIGFSFLLPRGRIVLQSDRLIEYNFLNQSRVFTYAQIFEVKRGTHADQTWIRYYPMINAGEINYRSTKGRILISVARDAEMRHELSRRISAPKPTLSQNMSPMLIVLLLGVLLIPLVVTVIYLVALQR